MGPGMGPGKAPGPMPPHEWPNVVPPSAQSTAPSSRDEPAASAPQKDARKMLVNHIYDTMVAKGFTSPNGHLLMDVFVEVWRGVNGQSGSAGGGKTALDRFASFLEMAPELFEVFDLDILPMSWATGLETATPEDKPPSSSRSSIWTSCR